MQEVNAMMPVYQVGPSVVVIDDDDDTVDMLCAALTQAGYRPAPCPPTERAHAFIRVRQPALVMLDVRMGSIDGIDLGQQLQADPRTRAIAVLLFTGTPDDLAARWPDYRQHGSHLLVKPCTQTQLEHAVAQALSAVSPPDEHGVD
jgi:CheY-like chemotaxis protein